MLAKHDATTSPRRFVITGCGRSGTTYMAKLLTAVGCSCGHEEYFPGLQQRGIFFFSQKHRFHVRMFTVGWLRPPWGEAAWEAVPFIKYLPKGTVVFHQVRNPIRYIRSRQKKGLTLPHFRQKHCPIAGWAPSAEEFHRLPMAEQAAYLARFWIAWNTMVEEATRKSGLTYVRYRIEDVGPAAVVRMLNTIGAPVNPARIDTVCRTMEKTTHSLGPTDEAITKDMLPSDLKLALQNQVTTYGYDEM